MKSFLHGRQVQKMDPLKSLSATAPGPGAKVQGAASHHDSGGASPTIECVKEGDKVVRLVVTCTCGEKIEIDCLYPAGK